MRYRTLCSAEYTGLSADAVSVAILRSLYRAVSAKEVTPAPMWNEVRAVLSEKACSPTVVTESGRITDDCAVRLNAKSPIVARRFSSGRKLTPSLALVDSKALPPREIVPPRSMRASLSAEQKAQVPTVSNFSGRVTEVSAERRNASSLIVRRLSGRVTDVMPAFWNALGAIVATPSRTVYVPPVFLAAGYRIRREWSLEYRTPSTLS